MVIKCFLSHSSLDKKRYIMPLYENLSRQGNTILDEKNFEEGMLTIEEINNYLDETSLFVIFFSDSALNSTWVREELNKAKDLLDRNKIDRIYPIIIDEKINHHDVRIPSWMKNSLNIQFIENYKIAARKITDRLRELSWSKHPRLKERQEIFVGRNELINKIEQRFDDFEISYPIAFIATGLPHIGRKSLIKHSLIKAGVIKPSYKFIEIKLDFNDGLENLLIYISDSGLYSLTNTDNDILKLGSFSDKVELAKAIFDKIKFRGEIIFIEDNGVIIQRDGNVVDWYEDILSSLSGFGKLLFCIKSQFRVKASINRINPLIFSLEVKELELSERKGLLKRYAEFQEIISSINNSDLSFFLDILTGYPEQVLFCIDQIKELGIYNAKKQSHIIQQYASDKARIVLDKYKDDNDKIEFISLLSKFEFVTHEVLFKIVDEEKYSPILDELKFNSICEMFGKTSEYIRLNNVIRDYVSRNSFGKANFFDKKINSYVEEFYQNYQSDYFDISGYLISAKQMVLNGKITSDIILPSVFMKVIKQLYDIDKNYDEVVNLSNYVLNNKKNIHSSMIEYVRFIKCQSLARQRKTNEFFEEVHNLSDISEQEFLKGFLYRIQGKINISEDHLKRSLSLKGYDDPKIIGEMIRIYMQNEEYGKALELSKQNYNKRPENLINVNDYFICLLMQDDKREFRSELENIINRLEIDPSEKAQEILLSMKARMKLFYDNDPCSSLDIINEAINRFPKISYPLLTKADISVYIKDQVNLKEALLLLERITHKNAQTYRPFIRYKAILLAMEGRKDDAISLVNKELNGFSESNIRKLKDKINQYS